MGFASSVVHLPETTIIMLTYHGHHTLILSVLAEYRSVKPTGCQLGDIPLHVQEAVEGHL